MATETTPPPLDSETGWTVELWSKTNLLKGPVHQLDMQVLIKGHCRCDQNAIGLVTFGGQGKEKFTYLFSKFSKNKITYPKLMRTYPKLLRTNGKLAPKFGVGAPKFGVGAPKFRVGAHKFRVR